jgi:deazaflavin-dependent oxidoreductase (nitroreductase family)
MGGLQHLANPLAVRMSARGVATLTVVGRRTGEPRKVPVVPVEVGQSRYLVSPYGESDWVRSLRAAGQGELSSKGQTEVLHASEVPVEERGDIIARYREVAGSHIGPSFTKLPDPLEPGYSSNFGERRMASYIYLTATLDAATWGAELAVGEGPGRIYRVEPTGPFEDDPNLTDKKFPGNPTRSHRTREPLRVVAEILDWEPHSPEVLQDIRNHLEKFKQLGIEAVND